MKKKLLFGSILTIIILLAIPINSVISLEQKEARSSPLYQTRTDKALGQEEELIISEYVGKGQEVVITNFAPSEAQNMIKRIFNAVENEDEQELIRINQEIEDNLYLQKAISEYFNLNGNSITTEPNPVVCWLGLIGLFFGQLCLIFNTFN